MRKSVAAAAVAGSLLAGGAGAALFGGPLAAGAQSTPTTQPATGEARSGDHGRHGGAHNEAISDASVAARAIGISEDDLVTAVKAGQSLAAIAGAHGVDPQKVIDALVADGRSEIDAALKAGKLTQAKADEVTSGLAARVAEHVNRTGGGPGDHGHENGPRHDRGIPRS